MKEKRKWKRKENEKDKENEKEKKMKENRKWKRKENEKDNENEKENKNQKDTDDNISLECWLLKITSACKYKHQQKNNIVNVSKYSDKYNYDIWLTSTVFDQYLQSECRLTNLNVL